MESELTSMALKWSSHGGLVVEAWLGDAMVPGSNPGVVAETNIVSCVENFSRQLFVEKPPVQLRGL